VINHLVLLGFPDDELVREAVLKLRSLEDAIPDIRALEVHEDIAGKSASGHQLILLTTHDSDEALEKYKKNPAHVAAAGWLRSHVSSAAEFDWRSDS
jgi:Stress responsive A/B Barrel Domain